MGALLLSLLRARGVWAALGIQVAASAVLSFIPLFDILGFERAFVTALIAGPASMSLATLAKRRGPIDQAAILTLLLQLLALGASAGAGFLVERVRGSCAPEDGLIFLGVLAGSTSLLGIALGLLTETVAPRWGGLLGGLVIIVELGVVLHRAWAEPQIDAFSVFLGYWPGSLYDEDLPLSNALLAHRALSVLTAAVLFLLASAISLRRWGRLAGALVLAGAALGLAHRGESLGFDRDRATIARTLDRIVTGQGYILRFDPSIRRDQLDRFVEEQELRMAQLRRFFGRSPSVPITVWVYANEGQKRALMGASGTQISRPWSHEVHLDGFGVPHGVLKHELAHVFAADFATGPLHVPAALGFIPNLVLIEGLAVAADWPARSGLTTHQWTRAMRTLKLAPDVAESLYPGGFWKASSSRAYTVAGSFVRYLVDTYGIHKFGLAYRSGDLEEAYGRPLDQLVAEWATMVDAVPLEPEDLLLAEHVFRGGSIFQRACARATAAKAREADRALGRGELEQAQKEIARTLELDPSRVDLIMSLARARAAQKDLVRARQDAARVEADARASKRTRAQAAELGADFAWRQGETAAAATAYRSVLAQHFSEEIDRLQQVKLAALTRTGTTGRVLARYLAGELSMERAAPLLAARHVEEPTDAVVTYLLARAYEGLGLDEEAAATIAPTLTSTLPSAAVRREAQMVLGRTLLKSGQRARSAEHFLQVARTSTRAARRLEAEDWAERASLVLEAPRTLPVR